MKAAAIVNPRAGGGRAWRAWCEVAGTIDRRLGGVECAVTKAPGHAAVLARELAVRGFDTLVAAGGDGTLNEVVGGVLASGADLVVGLLPLGTGGDFARTVGIHGVAHAIEVLGEGKVRRLDAMRARYRVGEGHRERYFVNAASIGLGAEVARAVNAGGSMLRGRARYLAAALRTLARGCSYAVTLRVDGAPAQYYNSTTIAIGNGRYQGGGMLLAPLAKADDGQIDVTVVDEVSLATVATNVSKLYSGSIYTDRRAHHLRGSRLSAESSGDVPFECDGELVGKLPVEIEVVAGAWRLLAPERAN